MWRQIPADLYVWYNALEKEHFRLGSRAWQSGRWAEAIKEYDQAESAYTDEAVFYYARGRAHYKLGQSNYQAAWNDLSRALQLDSNLHGARLYRALVAITLFKYQEILDDTRMLLDDPYYRINEKVHYLNGYALWKLNNRQRAEERFQECLKHCSADQKKIYENLILAIKNKRNEDIVLVDPEETLTNRVLAKTSDSKAETIIIPEGLGATIDKSDSGTPTTLLPQHRLFDSSNKK